MSEKVLIFGKDTWPFTTEAREAFKKEGRTVEYVNVKSDPEQLAIMLKHSNGTRKVPVIIDQGKVTIGHKGNSWGV